MLCHIPRLETRISSEHDEYSVNNVILSLTPIGTLQLWLEITPLSNEVTNRFPFSSWMSHNCPGACFGGSSVSWLFKERCAGVTCSHPVRLAGGDKTAHFHLWHFSARKKGTRHQTVGWEASEQPPVRHWQRNFQKPSSGDEFPGLKQTDIKGGGAFQPTQQDLLLLDEAADKHIQPHMLCSW